MTKGSVGFRIYTLLMIVGVSLATTSAQEQVLWELDNLKTIGGQAVTVVGEPKVIETPHGKALEFDGVDDGIFLDVHPMAGWATFTVEVIFQPYKDGQTEQRFFHMQEDGTTERVMFETRLVADNMLRRTHGLTPMARHFAFKFFPDA